MKVTGGNFFGSRVKPTLVSDLFAMGYTDQQMGLLENFGQLEGQALITGVGEMMKAQPWPKGSYIHAANDIVSQRPDNGFTAGFIKKPMVKTEAGNYLAKARNARLNIDPRMKIFSKMKTALGYHAVVLDQRILLSVEDFLSRKRQDTTPASGLEAANAGNRVDIIRIGLCDTEEYTAQSGMMQSYINSRVLYYLKELAPAYLPPRFEIGDVRNIAIPTLPTNPMFFSNSVDEMISLFQCDGRPSLAVHYFTYRMPIIDGRTSKYDYNIPDMIGQSHKTPVFGSFGHAHLDAWLSTGFPPDGDEIKVGTWDRYAPERFVFARVGGLCQTYSLISALSTQGLYVGDQYTSINAVGFATTFARLETFSTTPLFGGRGSVLMNVIYKLVGGGYNGNIAAFDLDLFSVFGDQQASGGVTQRFAGDYDFGDYQPSGRPVQAPGKHFSGTEADYLQHLLSVINIDPDFRLSNTPSKATRVAFLRMIELAMPMSTLMGTFIGKVTRISGKPELALSDNLLSGRNATRLQGTQLHVWKKSVDFLMDDSSIYATY